MATAAFVGDVHGCFDELIELEAVLADRLGEPAYLVFVGDLVDRGPSSSSVVQHVADLATAGRAACVMGNHDDMFLSNVLLHQPEWSIDVGVDQAAVGAILRSLPPAVHNAVFQNWYVQGGKETLASYGVDSVEASVWHVDAAHIAFLASLPLYWQDDTVVVTHAAADSSDLATIRATKNQWSAPPAVRESLLWNRHEPLEPPDPDRLHISGHTPRSIPLVRRKARAIQIDTGCVYGNALTAYIPRHDTFVQVSSRQV